MTEPDFQTLLNHIPYAKTLGVIPLLIGQALVMKLPFNPDNIGNPFLPAIHGGVIGGFMEITAISQLIYSNQFDHTPKPVGLNIDYLRPGHPMDSFAEAMIIRQGSRIANVRVTAWQDDRDAPIAALHGHYLTANPD